MSFIFCSQWFNEQCCIKWQTIKWNKIKQFTQFLSFCFILSLKKDQFHSTLTAARLLQPILNEVRSKNCSECSAYQSFCVTSVSRYIPSMLVSAGCECRRDYSRPRLDSGAAWGPRILTSSRARHRTPNGSRCIHHRASVHVTESSRRQRTKCRVNDCETEAQCMMNGDHREEQS